VSCTVYGLWFMVSCFRVQGLGFRVWSLWLGVYVDGVLETREGDGHGGRVDGEVLEDLERRRGARLVQEFRD
jgi:hypothetical protein